MARLLIVTNGALSRNPRVVKEAGALTAAGHHVTVLGVRNHRGSLASDAELAAAGGFTHRQVELLEGRQAMLRRLAIRLARDLAYRAGIPSVHALGPALPLLRAARRESADLTLVHNEIAHWAGLRLLRSGWRVSADMEDWHSEDLLPADRRGRPLRALRRCERALLHRAAFVTTTSEALANALHTRYGGRRAAVITNAFPLGPCALDRAGAVPRLFWFSQTLGPGRGLETFLSAWQRTRVSSELVLLGEPTAGYLERLLGPLPPERRERVRLRSLVSPSSLPAVIAEHDIGLALESPAIPSRDLTITNKILQYLNAGLAVIASPTRGQREVLARRPESGWLGSFEDPQTAAGRLDSWLGDPEILRKRRRSARVLAEERYCWEREAPRLVELVRSALGADSGPPA